MEVWSSWSPLFWPGGELISRLFGKRVQQLALPMRPLDVSRGLDGRVAVIADGAGAQVAAGWARSLAATVTWCSVDVIRAEHFPVRSDRVSM